MIDNHLHSWRFAGEKAFASGILAKAFFVF
jgi:hypothetical protein